MLPKPDIIDRRTIKVVSNEFITQETLQKIRDIFSESNCPNESMFNSIPGFNRLCDDVVIIGNVDLHFATVQV